MTFVDYVKIHVKAGDGGRGCVSFRREKYVPRGGPNGGDGGRGGHVIIKATEDMNTLLDLRYKHSYTAKRGEHGKGKNMHGKNSDDLIIPVPVGTMIKDGDTGEVIADLDTKESEIVIAKAGRGGLGNQHFATATRQAPMFAQPGEEGEEKNLIIELKLLADVGLIGFPNAGKSTFISVISSARPKIADYPFTTLVPNLGVVKLENFRSFVVADIPGLIEGAHKGLGLGFQFLRHAERTFMLLHLVDVSVMSNTDPVEDLQKINRELELYDEKLAGKAQVVVASKLDIVDKPKLDSLSEYCNANKLEFFSVSAITGEGMNALMTYVAKRLMELR